MQMTKQAQIYPFGAISANLVCQHTGVIFDRMFFYLSKILAFLIAPVTWIFILLLYALFSKVQSRKRKSLIGAIIIAYTFSNSFLFDEMMRAWEIPAVKYEELDTCDAGIVLGGMMDYDKEFDRLQFYRGSDRLWQAIALYRKGKIKKILFSGGSGSITYPEKKEAPLVKKYLITLGIPGDDILTESESKNSYENAINTKSILFENFPGGKYLLITSACHMRRAMACFKKEGIKVIPYSTDRYSGPRKFQLDHLLIPSAETLFNWNNLIHEWVGFIIYKTAGYA
jgi:uncharacterized SAM-binding protein YcdF (DUF218 family)